MAQRVLAPVSSAVNPVHAPTPKYAPTTGRETGIASSSVNSSPTVSLAYVVSNWLASGLADFFIILFLNSLACLLLGWWLLAIVNWLAAWLSDLVVWSFG